MASVGDFRCLLCYTVVVAGLIKQLRKRLQKQLLGKRRHRQGLVTYLPCGSQVSVAPTHA